MKRDLIFLAFISSLNIYGIKGSAEFLAKANPGFLEIEGKPIEVDSSSAKIEGSKVSGSFSVDLKNLRTGIDQRDEHLKGYIESEKFPKATLKLNPIEINKGAKKDFDGELTLHGVTKPVKGSVYFASTKAMAIFTIDVTDYGIKVPTYKLLTVGKEVEIKVTLDI